MRILKIKKPEDVLLTLVSYLPLQGRESELKTKPTQYAVRTLNSAGLQPDIIIARANVPIDKKRKEKIAFNCSIAEDDVISAPDVKSIYDIPINFEKDGLGHRILEKFGLKPRKNDLAEWTAMVKKIKSAKRQVNIGIVGKYFSTGDFTLADSYISVIEAIKHAGAAKQCQPKLSWINAEDVEKRGVSVLKKLDGIIVPQGWGSRGAEGKIATIKYCRENKVPYFGLCYGMQMAVIEFARDVLGFKGANSEEVDAITLFPSPLARCKPLSKFF
mgnify:CR=1 FL=1